MALIVETGQNVPGAESYLSVADANSYHKARGNTAWDDLETPDKEAALRRATDYLLQTYRGVWKGMRTNVSQALDWPRFEVYLDDAANGDIRGYSVNGVQALAILVPSDSVPNEVKTATAMLALRAAAGELMPDLDRAVTQKTIGPITTVYDRFSPQQRRYVAVDAVLRPLLKNGATTSGGMMKLVRA